MKTSRSFLIGQYGGFDAAKQIRDFRPGFYGVEACLFQTEEDRRKLAAEAKRQCFRIGVHYPFRAFPGQMRDLLFLAKDRETRSNAYREAQSELEYLTALAPRYVLFHYPKPVILGPHADWSKWRFSSPLEYVREEDFTCGEFMEASGELFAWLDQKGVEFGFTPVLELDGLNSYVTRGGVLEQLLQRYPRIKLCLDTGRLFLQDCTDPDFDALHVLRHYAKYALLVHLWTLQYRDGIRHYHHPVLPEQNPQEGWAPIGDYLDIIAAENPDAMIHFEHMSGLISDADLERCYSWVKERLET